jgi:hypothetical protein
MRLSFVTCPVCRSSGGHPGSGDGAAADPEGVERDGGGAGPEAEGRYWATASGDRDSEAGR